MRMQSNTTQSAYQLARRLLTKYCRHCVMGVQKMISLEVLLIVTTGAVSPYVAFAIFDWVKQRKTHSSHS